MIARPLEYPAPPGAKAVKPQSLRVLHIVENLDNQAVETWLLRMLRNSREDYQHIHWTFFCVAGKEGRFDDEARKLGAHVIHSRYEVGDKRRFVLGLRAVMRQGRFDILHCHHDIMSAAYLMASARLPFRKRIVHLHNTELGLPTPSKIKSGLAREPMRQICLRMADQIVGISNEALDSLTSGNRKPGRDVVVHYGVETKLFAQPMPDRVEFRRQLGFAPDAKILLFVGRMVDYKNPLFVVEILEHLRKSDSDVVAVFAGAGPLEKPVQALAEEKGLALALKVLGFRRDVSQMMHGSDLLIWPSVEEPREGLGLGIIEAQAAGLPILMSRSVPDEAVVVPELVQVLPLAAGAAAWADVARSSLQKSHLSRSEALLRVERSSFSLAQGVSNLMALYEEPRPIEPVK